MQRARGMKTAVSGNRGEAMSQDTETGIRLNRRQALVLSAAGMGLALAKSSHASDSTKTGVHQEPGNCSTPRSAVANTQYGKVRGFLDGGVFTFKGILCLAKTPSGSILLYFL
jgi:hypothetical protein